MFPTRYKDSCLQTWRKSEVTEAFGLRWGPLASQQAPGVTSTFPDHVEIHHFLLWHMLSLPKPHIRMAQIPPIQLTRIPKEDCGTGSP